MTFLICKHPVSPARRFNVKLSRQNFRFSLSSLSSLSHRITIIRPNSRTPAKADVLPAITILLLIYCDLISQLSKSRLCGVFLLSNRRCCSLEIVSEDSPGHVAAPARPLPPLNLPQIHIIYWACIPLCGLLTHKHACHLSASLLLDAWLLAYYAFHSCCSKVLPAIRPTELLNNFKRRCLLENMFLICSCLRYPALIGLGAAQDTT